MLQQKQRFFAEGEKRYEYSAPLTSPFYRHCISPLCEWICSKFCPRWLSPNAITMIGLGWALLAVFLADNGYIKLAALFWVFYAMCDNLDGKQARLLNKSSIEGEYLDHVVDSFASSLLALMLFKSLIPQCIEAEKFTLRSDLMAGSSLIKGGGSGTLLPGSGTLLPGTLLPEGSITGVLSRDLAPVLSLLLIVYLPFYLGCWCHVVFGKLLIGSNIGSNMGSNRRDWFTVDEVNFFLVPAVSLISSLYPSFISWTPQKNPIGTGLILPIGHDCSNRWLLSSSNDSSDGQTLTIGSTFVGIMCVFTLFNGFNVIRILIKESRKTHQMHLLWSLLIFSFLVLALPLPPFILAPFFSWMCSCVMISRLALKANIDPASLPPLITKKTYPLLTMTFCAAALRIVSNIMDERLVVYVTIFAMALSILGITYVVRASFQTLRFKQSNPPLFRQPQLVLVGANPPQVVLVGANPPQVVAASRAMLTGSTLRKVGEEKEKIISSSKISPPPPSSSSSSSSSLPVQRISGKVTIKEDHDRQHH